MGMERLAVLGEVDQAAPWTRTDDSTPGAVFKAAPRASFGRTRSGSSGPSPAAVRSSLVLIWALCTHPEAQALCLPGSSPALSSNAWAAAGFVGGQMIARVIS